MGTFNSHESNKFAEAAVAAGQEYLVDRDKILSDGASRGFPLVPGESLSALIQAGLKARQKLTEMAGKIYDEERARILELSDFNLKLIVETTKIAMLSYRNALKRYSEEVEHELRGQEINHELLAEQEEIGMAALRLLQVQVRLAIQQYQNEIRSLILALKLLLDEGRIDLNLLIHLTRLTINEMAQVALDQNEVRNAGQILLTELANLQKLTTDPQGGTYVTTLAGAYEVVATQSNTLATKLINKLDESGP